MSNIGAPNWWLRDKMMFKVMQKIVLQKLKNLTLDGFNVGQTNGVTFRSWHGLSPLGTTKVVLDLNNTLYLPENNGVPFGSNNSNHTQSIIGISGLYKIQSNTQ